MKVLITKVDNGYILKVISTGQSIIKEPYHHKTLVFTELCKLEEWMENFFEKEK